MEQSLNGKVAIVTGAGRGMGRAEALALAAAGASVVVNDVGADLDGTGVDHSFANGVVAEIRANGGDAVANYGDIAEMSTGVQLVRQALDVYGRLDILVNNAGILRPKPLHEYSEADWDRLIGVHLKGPFVSIHAAAQIFTRQSSGRIVNTSSHAAFGMPLHAGYAAGKEGVTGLTRTLALELAPYQVTVNQIRPRSAETRMSAGGVKPDTSASPSVEVQPEPGRFSAPPPGPSDRVADFVVFLCGDEASGITGGDFFVASGQVTVLAQEAPRGTVDWLSLDGPKRLTELVDADHGHWTKARVG